MVIMYSLLSVPCTARGFSTGLFLVGPAKVKACGWGPEFEAKFNMILFFRKLQHVDAAIFNAELFIAPNITAGNSKIKGFNKVHVLGKL